MIQDLKPLLVIPFLCLGTQKYILAILVQAQSTVLLLRRTMMKNEAVTHSYTPTTLWWIFITAAAELIPISLKSVFHREAGHDLN